jgi:hypothetical protein
MRSPSRCRSASISIPDPIRCRTRLSPEPFTRDQMMITRQDIERVPRPNSIAASAASATAARHEKDDSVCSNPVARLHALFPWVCALAGWGAISAIGFMVLEAYATSPGARGRSLGDWPQSCGIPIDGRKPTLLIFLHPLCPCSSASIDELREIVARLGDRVRLHAVVLRTDTLQRQGTGVIERSLAEVRGMRIWHDNGGALARRFGVLTSGHVLLYDSSGRLTFSGGITPTRGHRGNDSGESALRAAILGDPSDRSSIPVIGCPLFEFRPAMALEAHQ